MTVMDPTPMSPYSATQHSVTPHMNAFPEAPSLGTPNVGVPMDAAHVRAASSGSNRASDIAGAVVGTLKTTAGMLGTATAPVAAWVREHPTTALCRTAATLIVLVTVQNAAFGQHEAHSAPWFGDETTMTETVPASPVAAPTVAEEARRADPVVFGLQSELTDRGFYNGTIDGVQGPQTRAAIEAFEQSVGLSPRGDATSALLERIRLGPVAALPRPASRASAMRSDAVETGSVPQTNAAPDPKARIRSVQEGLAAYGQDIVADGVIGPMTRAAISEFEGAHGMPVTGEPTDALLERLKAEGLI